MSSLSPRLQVRVAQKQTLTPGLVQMVSLLQLTRLELKDMISAEVAQNPVLDEATEGGEELTPEELQPLLEAERLAEPADQSILEVTAGPVEIETEGTRAGFRSGSSGRRRWRGVCFRGGGGPGNNPGHPRRKDRQRSFDEIDYGEYFNDYLDPGFKSPASENVEKPSFETFLSSPVTLSDHLHSQLALVALSEQVARRGGELCWGTWMKTGT
jgi:RNA polymerase sigma-54 factor